MDPRIQAHKILNRFAIDEVGPVPVETMAVGLDLMVETKPIDGAEGRLVRGRSGGLVVVNDGIRNRGKRRFVIAHELGHFVLHKEPEKFSICNEQAFVDWHGHRPHEKEANVFAAELLMPNRLYREEAQFREMNAETIDELREIFDVSFTAAAIRYVDLDVVPCAVVCTRDGEIQWFRTSDSFPYDWVPVGTDARPYSGAGEYFRNGSVSDEPEVTACEEWFEDDYRTVEGDCLEQCVTMPNHNSVLSLIWLL
jgi:hypothetical protein